MTISLGTVRNARSVPHGLLAMEIAATAAAPVTLQDHLAALQPFATRQSFGRNATIFDEGDPVDCVYKVVSGVVRQCRYAPDGRRHIVDFALPGDLIGLHECADQPFAAEAVTAASLVAYPRGAFDRLAARDPAIQTRIVCHLSAALLETQRHLFVVGCQSARERVASFLLRLAERLDIAPGVRFEPPMGRRDIADHLGLTIETVCRSITQLKIEGAVAVPSARQLVLTNVPALRRIALES